MSRVGDVWSRGVLTLLALLLSISFAACGDDSDSDGGHGSVHGKRLKVELRYGNNSRPYMPWPEDVAKQLAAAMESAGIDVTLRKEEWNPFLDQVKNGEHQMAILGWSADVADPDNFLYVLLDKDNARPGSANNISFYDSEEVHQLLIKAQQIGNQDERAKLYMKAQEIIFDDVPMIPLVYGPKLHAHRKSVGPVAVQLVTHPLLRLIETPKDGDIFYLRGNDSEMLDPADVTDGESSKVIEQIFDTLTRFKSGTSVVEPSLAESWTHNEDRTQWTFRIRSGVKFHDGTTVDGAAVVNAFERQRDAKHPHHFPGGSWSYWQDNFKFVDKVRLGDDPMDVVFELDRAPPPFFLSLLAMFTCSIPSPTALQKHGEDFRRKPVGSGPFKFVSWKSGVDIKLTRNDDYWDGAPAIRSVAFLVARDPTVRAERLASGMRADIIDNIDPLTVRKLESDAGVTVAKAPGVNMCYAAMNTQKPPFDNKLVRQAIAYLVDKNRIVKVVYRGDAKAATTPLPPTLFGHNTNIVDRTRDVEKAKALLKQAGYAVGD